jgi:peptidoglycan/LPS O-acetylase OafA/YrhL
VIDRKILNIQAMRAFAVMLVVFSHLVHIERKYGHHETFLSNYLLYGVSGVDLFFVISGFVMVTVSWKTQDQSLLYPLQFLYNRITRIYPVYWFYSAIVLAVYYYRPEMVNSSQGNQVLIVESFLLWPQKLAPLLAVAWTLTHEMYFYLMFTLMLWGGRGHLQRYLFFWMIAVIIGNLVLPSSTSPLIKIIFHPLTLEFIAGCIVAHVVLRGYTGYGRLYLFGGGILLLFSTAGCYAYFGSVFPDGWYRVLFFGAPCSLMVYGAVASEFKGRLYFPPWLNAIGDASYSIYLSHVLVLSVLGRVWYQFGQEGLYDNYLVFAFMILLVIVYGYLSFRYIEKPIIRSFRKYRAKIFMGM